MSAVSGSTSLSLPVILRRACQGVGLPSGGAELLRLGENAIYRLAGQGVVVRIGRQGRTPVAARELRLARWLAGEGVASVAVHDVPGQPLTIAGHPVTFWRAADGEGPPPSHTDLGRLLRALHGLDGPPPCGLPAFAPFTLIRAQLEEARIDDQARAFLLRRCEELSCELATMEYALAPGLIHGDAHVRNLLCDRGSVLLSDFEAVAVGPREWDLLPTLIDHVRAGLPPEQYRSFAAAYGFDVRSWPGWQALRETREISMTCWLAQSADEDPAIKAEVDNRLTALRERHRDQSWTYQLRTTLAAYWRERT